MFFFGTFSHFIPYSLLIVFYLVYFIVSLTVKPAEDDNPQLNDKINFLSAEKNKPLTAVDKKEILCFNGIKKLKKQIKHTLSVFNSPYYFILHQKSKFPVVFFYVKTFYFDCFLYQRPPPFS